MSDLSPVPGPYDPGYPTSLTPEEVQELLRPSLFRRFSRDAMLAGALLTGAMTTPAAAQDASNTRRANPKLAKKVDRLVRELLGPEEKGWSWSERTTPILRTELRGNPPVKYPRIAISFGNSYSGVFDVARAKAATRKLFEAYGISLGPAKALEGPGYTVNVDGWDAKTKTGFVLLDEDDEGLAPEVAQALGAQEDVRLFVATSASYPNMDGDQRTPLTYYMASVVDYLDWVHGERRIAKNKVFGVLAGGLNRPGNSPTFPGCDFEEPKDLELWESCWRLLELGEGVGELRQGTSGELGIDEDWSGGGARSLRARLEPGAELIYEPPGDGLDLVDGARVWCDLYFEGDDDDVVVTLTFEDERGKTSVVQANARNGSSANVYGSLGRGLGKIQRVRISATNRKSGVLYVDRLQGRLKSKE